MKKALALFLCLVMLLSLFPAAVFAETDKEAIPDEAATQTDIETSKESVGDSTLDVPEMTDEPEIPDEAVGDGVPDVPETTDESESPDESVGDGVPDVPETSDEPESSDESVGDGTLDVPETVDELESLDESAELARSADGGRTVVNSGTCGAQGDNLTWTLYDDGVLVIEGEGDMADFPNDGENCSAPWGCYRRYWTEISVVISENATSIGNNAFGYFWPLKTVTIPDSITRIGDSAFCECEIASVEIPNSVTDIGKFAFYKCFSLTSVTISDSVTSIKELTFSQCSHLTSVEIPDSVISIGEEAFSECGSLVNVEIPDSVTSIGGAAFRECSSLVSVTIPDSITSIDYGVFLYCSSLANVTIPDGVTSIGFAAFSDCTGLTSVTIPSSVTSIGEAAFCGCSSLTSVTIPNNVTSISEWAFGGCSSLTNVTIPDGVITIGELAFSGCSSLVNLSFPNSLRVIGNNAFLQCTGLKTVYFGNGLRTLGASAFKGCSGLTELTFTGDIPSISGSSFTGVSATAYYPSDNSSYSEDKQLGYGGTLTWTPYGGRFSVCYDPNGGSVEPSSVTVVQGESLVLPTPTREGYSFLGWAEDASAAYGVTGSYTPSGNVTLYAIWQEEEVPEEQAVISIDSVTAYTGKEVSIPISLENNPGLIGIEFTVSYDSTVLEWTGVEPGEFGEAGDYELAVGQPLAWFASDERADVSLDGVFATLTFRVRDSAAAGQTSVTITYNEEDIFNAKLENVAFAVKPGTVTVKTHIPGDITGDGNVNNKDYMALRRYIKYHDNEVVEAALDITGDGKVNNKDYMALRRYIKYHDIEIC